MRRAVRVIPDVAGIDKQFDYDVPADMADAMRIGTRVRIDLHGRRVGGWVVDVDVEPPAGVELKPVAKVTGWGPPADLVDLSAWASRRWAGRRTAILRSASPDRAHATLPPPAAALPRRSDHPHPLGNTVLRLGPGADRMPALRAIAAHGPALIVATGAAEAQALARRLGGDGHDVALVPQQWGQARAGGRVVIGARGAAWAPAPGVRTYVLLDAHDEVHQEERVPAWHARDVLGERARRDCVPCVALSPCPDLATLAWADRVEAPARNVERQAWPLVEVVDLREEDPANGLLSTRLTEVVRSDQRVICVLNRTGRARLLACAGCGELARCDRCEAAVTQAEGDLVCPRCDDRRPAVCAACGRQRLKVLRPGVSRLRDDLAALVAGPVGEVTATSSVDPDARVVIGTEAALHRAGRADVVAFLDLDQELLAPRYRAVEQTMALLARAGRLVGGRGRGGRLLLQTRLPDHDAVRAAVNGDPDAVVEAERIRRKALGMPPYRALAAISGAAAAAYVEGLDGVEVLGPADGTWLARAADSETLAAALEHAPRPPGRLRIEVDPLRV